MTLAFDAAEAERACARTIKRFALAADAGLHAELAGLFTVDARFNRPSEPDRVLAGRGAIEADFAGRAPMANAHLVLNIVVDVEGPLAARATSYIMAASGPLAASADAFPVATAGFRVGVFADRLRCEDGRWLISERVGRMLIVTGAG